MKENRVLKVLWVSKDLLAHKDIREEMVKMGFKDLQGHKVHQAQQGQWGLQVHKALLDLLALYLAVYKGFKDLKVIGDQKDLSDHGDFKDHKESKDLLALMVLLDLWVLQDQEDSKVKLALKDFKDLLVLQVLQDLKELQGEMDVTAAMV